MRSGVSHRRQGTLKCTPRLIHVKAMPYEVRRAPEFDYAFLKVDYHSCLIHWIFRLRSSCSEDNIRVIVDTIQTEQSRECTYPGAWQPECCHAPGYCDSTGSHKRRSLEDTLITAKEISGSMNQEDNSRHGQCQTDSLTPNQETRRSMA